MAAITVDRSGRIQVDGALWGHVERDGSVTRRDTDRETGTVVVAHTPIGTVARVETVKGVRWAGTIVGHGPTPIEFHKTRRACVESVVSVHLEMVESIDFNDRALADMAARDGRPVHDRHRLVCERYGHAARAWYGADEDGICPRCGESVESAPVESCPTSTIPPSDTCPVCVSVDGDCLCAPVESVEPCPCGGSYIDGVCRSCDSCSGCAECAPKHSYAGSVSHEVLSVDVQRHAAYLDAPASVVARVRVRYSYPDAPDRVHGFLFSFNEDEPWSVRMTSTVPSGTGLATVYNPDRFGSFSADPVSWIHAFYA